MKGMNAFVAPVHTNSLSPGNQGSLTVRSCSARRISEVTGSLEVSTLSFRILRAYFREWAHSNFVGILLKAFQTKQLSASEINSTARLTKPPLLSSQASCGIHLSSGVSRSCVSHNASNTGSSKLLQQHANATAVAFASEATSSHARSLRISSTLRQECILNLENAMSRWVAGN